jgi:hypothetical protein
VSARHRLERLSGKDSADLERLHAVPEGTPGAVPRTVTQEIPVSVIHRAGGAREVVRHDAEPCYGCACCVVWSVNLNTLAEAIRGHDGPQHPAPADCLVCQMLAGNLDAGAL